MKKRFTEEQIVAVLRDAESGQKVAGRGLPQALDQRANVLRLASQVRLDGRERVKRLRELEKENARLKRLLAERDVEVDVMKELPQKK
jgi:putative transposase